MNNISKKDKTYYVGIAFSILLFAMFFYLIPMTLDDWQWGSKNGDELLKNFFAFENGRYLGNCTIYLMTRSKAFKICFMSLITAGLCSEISKYAISKRNIKAYYLTVFFLFITTFLGLIHPKANIFAQTIGWMSGFANYVTPIFCIMVYINSVNNYYLYNVLNESKVSVLSKFALGIVSCLFVETATLFCLFLSSAVIFYFLVFRKEIHKSHISYFAGTVLGTALMLTSPTYRQSLTPKGNEETAESTLRRVGLLQISSIQESLREYNISTKIAIAAVLFILLIIVVSLIIPLLITKDKQTRIRLYSPLLFTLVFTLPMFFVNGGDVTYIFSSRLYFAQLIMVIIFILEIISILIKKCNNKTKQWFTFVLAIVFCALTVFYGYIYSNIHTIEAQRNIYVQEQLNNNSKKIEIIKYPERYEKYITYANGFEFYVDFYLDISNDKEVILIPYQG